MCSAEVSGSFEEWLAGGFLILCEVLSPCLARCIYVNLTNPMLFRFLSLSPSESSSSFKISHIVPIGILLTLVTFLIPYQLAFIVLYLLHCQTTLSSLPSSSSTDISVISRSNFNISITFLMLWLLPLNGAVLVVWVRDLIGGWVEWAGTDNWVGDLVGVLGIVEVCARGRFLRQETKDRFDSFFFRFSLFFSTDNAHHIAPFSLLARILELGFFALSAISFVFGSWFTYRLYDFSNILLALVAFGCVASSP